MNFTAAVFPSKVTKSKPKKKPSISNNESIANTRRIKTIDGRITILPPYGKGDVWGAN